MDVWNDRLHYLVGILMSAIMADAVPPEACFANFRSDDCGGPPTPVMYYWKPGSRCEVGIWRGCLPNSNMFHDEYECINTCVFVERVEETNFHRVVIIPQISTDESESNSTFIDSTTDGLVTNVGNSTDTNTASTDGAGETGNSTLTSESNANPAGQNTTGATVEQGSDAPTTTAT